MISLNVVQGSAEWLQARIGIPTASQFHKIITQKTMKPSSSAAGYIYELIAEWVLGTPLNDYVSQYMERGTDMEESAVRFYELQRDIETEAVGFCLRDDGKVGCSPDRLVGPNGGLEIKCPSPRVHVGYLIGSPEDEYKAQVQGALWITGREWWDLLSFHPVMPPALVRCHRDDTFIKALAETVDVFLEQLETAREKMIALGCSPAKPE